MFIPTLVLLLGVLNSSGSALEAPKPEQPTLKIPGQVGIILNLLSSGDLVQAQIQIEEILLMRDIKSVTDIFTNALEYEFVNQNLQKLVVQIYDQKDKPMEIILALSVVYENVQQQNHTGLMMFLEQVILQIGNSRVGLQGIGQVLDFTFTVQTGSIRSAFSDALSLIFQQTQCFIVGPILLQAEQSAGPFADFLLQQVFEQNEQIQECLVIGEQMKIGENILDNLDDIDFATQEILQSLENEKIAAVYEVFVGALYENQTESLVGLLTDLFLQNNTIFTENLVLTLASVLENIDENQIEQINKVLSALFVNIENSSLEKIDTFAEFIVQGLSSNSTKLNFLNALENTVVNKQCQIPKLVQQVLQLIKDENDNLVLDLYQNNKVFIYCGQIQETKEFIPQAEIELPIVQKSAQKVPQMQKSLNVIESVPAEETYDELLDLPSSPTTPTPTPTPEAILTPPLALPQFYFQFSFTDPKNSSNA